MAHTVIRTDNLSGTKIPADALSVRFYDANNKEAAVDNGVIAVLGGYESGQRHILKATAATSTSDLNDCVLLAGVEVPYDERLKNLEDYTNEAGKPIRGYVLRSRNEFGVTEDGFVGGTAPDVDDEVGIGTGGKLDASGTGFGTCTAIEIAGRHTFYVIEIGKTEAVAAAVEDDTNN